MLHCPKKIYLVTVKFIVCRELIVKFKKPVCDFNFVAWLAILLEGAIRNCYTVVKKGWTW